MSMRTVQNFGLAVMIGCVLSLFAGCVEPPDPMPNVYIAGQTSGNALQGPEPPHPYLAFRETGL